jgi:MFS family permease
MAVWGLGTVLATRAASFSELAAYRFLVGLGEGAFFPTMNYVFGSWYRPDEIARRSGLFYVAGSIGTISNGFISARISEDLDGALGRASWAWMFLISGVIVFPVAIFGLLTFPGTPQHPNRRLFTDEELALAQTRLDAVGRRATQTLSLSKASLKRFFGRWHFWVLVPWSIVFQQGYASMLQNTYTLWFRSNERYSTSTVNSLTAVAPCVGIVFIVLFAWVADRFGAKARLPLFGVAHIIAFVGHIAFVAYDKSPFGYKWYAVAVSNVENAMVPVMYSWANLICTDDAEERAFVLSSMLAFAMACNTWVPILAMPTVEGPRFFKGYLLCLIMQPVSFAVACLVDYLHKRDQKKLLIKGREGA